MAEELEEQENVRSRSITTPPRRRGKSQSEDGRIRLQELNKELAEIKTAEEDGNPTYSSLQSSVCLFVRRLRVVGRRSSGCWLRRFWRLRNPRPRC